MGAKGEGPWVQTAEATGSCNMSGKGKDGCRLRAHPLASLGTQVRP